MKQLQAAPQRAAATPEPAVSPRPAALDQSPRMLAQRAAIDAAFGGTLQGAAFGSAGPPAASAVAQLKPQYALLAPQPAFAAKHLSANPSVELCSAMLVARKYRGWQNDGPAHTLIDSAVFPGAWQVPSISAGYKKTNELSVIQYQHIASDPAVVTAGSDWTVNSKLTARNPALGGNVTAVAPAQGHNGSANVPCSWSMAVNHLVGAEDKGITRTTVRWNAGTNEYTVKPDGSPAKVLPQATVHQ